VGTLLLSASSFDPEKAAAGEPNEPVFVQSAAAAQGAWRFMNNPRARLSKLVEPLRDVGRLRAKAVQSPFVMCVHDWCKLGFNHPKDDEVQLTHKTDTGYDLTMALLVSPDDGSPLAPMEMHLKTTNGILSTRVPAPDDMHHTDQVLATMKASRRWNVERPLLHVIDREVDSVDHFRQWHAADFKFLVRADDRVVVWRDGTCLLTKIRAKLRQENAFHRVNEDACYQGRPAQLWVAETNVTLKRPGKKNVRGKKKQIRGRPLHLRYIVVQLRDGQGRILAEWMLLTNASPRISAEQLAHCYYWRWRIESYFKLLKSHGQHIEQWQQHTGEAIARRLLVASMACVVVWQLMADSSPQAEVLKDILVRLSGRQTKRSRPHTAPALLAGLWTLLAARDLLALYTLEQLQQLIAKLPFIPTG
jgi:hypothetical protein